MYMYIKHYVDKNSINSSSSYILNMYEQVDVLNNPFKSYCCTLYDYVCGCIILMGLKNGIASIRGYIEPSFNIPPPVLTPPPPRGILNNLHNPGRNYKGEQGAFRQLNIQYGSWRTYRRKRKQDDATLQIMSIHYSLYKARNIKRQWS